jgi:hypothetical protein
METLYEKASLILNPGVYDSGKVYATKPFDGSGDLTFSRASNATRVASNGLIEKVRTNLILQSNSFDTTWTNTSSTETSGQAGYDGTNAAWLLETTGENGRLNQNVTAGVCTLSLYAKAGTVDFLRFQIVGPAAANAYFDLGNGTIGTTGSSAIATTITSVGGGWYRCTMSTTSCTAVRIFPAQADNDTSGTSGNILIQDSQLENGDIVTPYIETTTTAVSVGPVSGLPRLDYLNSTCPRLLLEPQRTNLALYSEQFDNAPWTRIALDSIVSNTEISPDGTLTAEKIIPNTTSTNHYLQQNATVVIGEDYTFSFFAKKGEYNFTGTFISALGISANWDLENGIASAGASIVDFGNGWYRCIASGVAISTTASSRIYAQNSTLSVFAGDGTSGIYAWGAQLEAGTYATSYIPTLGTSVTRVIDSSTLSVADTTNKTYFLDAKRLADDEETNSASFFGLGGLNITFWSSNRLRFRFGGAINQYYSLTGDDFKIAVSYNGTDSKVFINGSLRFTQTFTLINSTLSLTGNESVAYNEVLLFPTNLTDAQCIELTTL